MLPGGSADWLLLREDGVLELDFRATLRTDDGALISMRSFGLRHGPPDVIAALGRGETVDPATYYFRTTPRFETAHPTCTHLNRLVAGAASGDRRAEGPILYHPRDALNMPLTRRDVLKSAGALVRFAGRASPPLTKADAPGVEHREDRMNSRPLMILRLATRVRPRKSAPRDTGNALSIFPVSGGSFEGDRLRGKVLAGGGDWVTARPDGTLELDLRVTLETDDGALIHMTFTGGARRDVNHYFHALPRFESAASKYAFVNRLPCRAWCRGDWSARPRSRDRGDSLIES